MKILLAVFIVFTSLTINNAQQNTLQDTVEKTENAVIDSLKEASMVTQRTIDELKKNSLTGFIQM